MDQKRLSHGNFVKTLDKKLITRYYNAIRYNLLRYNATRYKQKESMVTGDRLEPETFLPLSPAKFHILLALARGEQHGYAIMVDVETQTGGRVTLGPGTLYGAIKRLLEDGLIEECDERPDPMLDDERRRYYRLTDLGLRVTSAEAARLASLVALARASHVLEDSPQGAT
jgi:DNA-binding PadR family transcriptional regulator